METTHSIEAFFASERWTPVLIHNTHAFDITLDSTKLEKGQFDAIHERIAGGLDEDDALIELALAVGVRWNLTSDGKAIDISTREALDRQPVLFVGGLMRACYHRVYTEVFPLSPPVTASTTG